MLCGVNNTDHQRTEFSDKKSALNFKISVLFSYYAMLLMSCTVIVQSPKHKVWKLWNIKSSLW